MTHDTEHVLETLRKTIRAHGYTHQDVEQKLGVAPGYLSRLFRGVIQLRFEHIVDIARALDMEPVELFELAYPRLPESPSESVRRRPRIDPIRVSPGSSATQASSIEEETERVERIVLRTLEKFFSSMAGKASGQR